MKISKEIKKGIKTIAKRLLPKPLKIYKSDVRRLQRVHQTSFTTALRKARIYNANQTKNATTDYVEQFAKICRRMNIGESNNYIYTLDSWILRKNQKDTWDLVSMTVDYATVLNSSLAEITKLLEKGKNKEFCVNEIRMIRSIRNLVYKIQKELNKEKNERNLQLSRYFEHILDNKPAILDEALQKILFYNGLFWQMYHWHNGLGRLDLILQEYYDADIEAGRITKLQAKEMLRDFVLVLGKDTRRKSCVLIGDTGQYILLGGIDKEGKTVQNDLTELFLEIFTELKVPDPKLILRVNENTSDVVWRKAVECICTGCGSPLLMNEKLIMDGMIEFGYKKEDVWNVGTSACWEPLIIGKSLDQNNPFPNIPVVSALNEVIANNEDMVDITSVIAQVKTKIAEQIAETVHDIPFDVSPLYSLFFDSCLEKEKDYAQGGADYAYHGVQIVGLPNLINALLNIEKYVFEQHILFWQDCQKMLAENFDGYEDVRKMLMGNDVKFGSAQPQIIQITNELMDFISKEVEKYTCNGEKLKVGFSSSQYIMASKNATASMDGRKDYEPFAVHISPVSQKIDIQEILDFAGSLNYSGNRMNGNVVDFILPSAYIRQQEKLVTILRHAMSKGGYELQLNVLDAATLRDAKAHPEKYPTLVVRVWGFSAYFNDLPESYKDNLIARAEANE